MDNAIYGGFSRPDEALIRRRNEEITEICNFVQRHRFNLWQDALAHLERTAEPGHTVVRFPNSSSYIFSTGPDCFWMVDPAYALDPGTEKEITALESLIREKISFILITHLHRDHCQPEWVKNLADAPVIWVVPDCIARSFTEEFGANPARTIVLKEQESTVLSGIRITAYRGYHREPGKVPVLSCAYDVTLPDGVKLFFPADVRDPSLPVPPGEVDYTFGHVFLGRENAAGDDFPHLPEVADFLARRPCKHLFLNHLYETGREPRDLWTHRHGEMLRTQLRAKAPGMTVTIPHFGDAVHLRNGGGVIYPDLYPAWSPGEQEEFLDHLGISIKNDHLAQMQEASARQIPVVEWTHHLLDAFSIQELREQAARWRAAGGKCLSIHLPHAPTPENPAGLEKFRYCIQIACETAADRVTLHVPDCSVQDAPEKLAGILDFTAELLMPLVQAGIRIGIENMHMKKFYQPDGTRQFGFIPEELRRTVLMLRERCTSTLPGAHLDIGHAYSNYPYSETYGLSDWLKTCGPLLNGLHLHQFEYAATPADPYLNGHALISGRNTGHPNLAPLYQAWQEGLFRAPMILEVCRGPEQQGFASRERMAYLFDC